MNNQKMDERIAEFLVNNIQDWDGFKEEFGKASTEEEKIKIIKKAVFEALETKSIEEAKERKEAQIQLGLPTINDSSEGLYLYGSLLADEEDGAIYPESLTSRVKKIEDSSTYIIYVWADDEYQASKLINDFLEPFDVEPFLLREMDEDGESDWLF